MRNRKKRIIRGIIAILSCIAMLQTSTLADAASVINGNSEVSSVDKVTVGMSDASAADVTVDVVATGATKKMTIAPSALSTYKLTNNGSSWVKVSMAPNSPGVDETNWVRDSSFYIIADENTSENERSQVITLTYRYYTKEINILVRQPGQEKKSPALSVDTSSITVDANGTASTSQVYVDTQNTGGFTAKTDGSDWIKVGEYSWNMGSEASFSNSSSFYVSFESNPTAEERTGYITVLHEDGVTQIQIAVSQAGQEKKQAVLNADVSNITVSAKGVGSVKKVNVDTGESGGFTVKTDADGWVKLGKYSYSGKDSELSFNSSGSFYVFFDKNSTSEERTQYITILHEDGVTETTIAVSQEKKEIFLDVDTSSIIVNAKGKSSVNKVKVNTKESGGFTVKTDGSDWIKLGRYSSYGSDSELSFSDSNSFYVSFESNPTADERSGSITILHDDGTTQKQISVTQSGLEAVLEVKPTEQTLDQKGSSYKDYISVNAGDTGSCTVEVQNATWLKVSREKESNVSMGLSRITISGKSGFYLLASKNTGEERTATVKLTHSIGGKEVTVTVTQVGKEKSYLEVDSERVDFDDYVAATSDKINVSADDDTDWTVSSPKSWVLVKSSPSGSGYASVKGSGDGSFYIYVKKNSSSKQRQAWITVSSSTDKSLKLKILVSQDPLEKKPKDLLKELTVSVSKKTVEKGKTTKVKFSYPEGLYPSDIKSVTYSSTKKKVATVSQKGVVKGVAKGKATIKVTVKTVDGGSKTFKIKMTVGKRQITKT